MSDDFKKIAAPPLPKEPEPEVKKPVETKKTTKKKKPKKPNCHRQCLPRFEWK